MINQASNQKPQSNNAQQNVKYNSFCKLLLLNLTYGLSGFFFGYVVVYFSAVDYPTIKQIYGLQGIQDSLATGLIIGTPFFGAFFGSFLSGPLLKYVSRRNGFLVANALAILMGIQIFVPSPVMLFGCRFGQGISMAFHSTLAPIMVNEISPISLAGTMGSLFQLQINFGVFFVFFMAFLLRLIDGFTGFWIIIFLIGTVVVVIQSILLIFVFPFQSPRNLMVKGKIDEAKQTLNWIYKQEYVSDILQQLKIDVSKMKQDKKPQTTNQQQQNIPQIGTPARFIDLQIETNRNPNRKFEQTKQKLQRKKPKFNQINLFPMASNQVQHRIATEQNMIESNIKNDINEDNKRSKKRSKSNKLFIFLSILLGAVMPLSGVGPINTYIYYFIGIVVPEQTQTISFVITIQIFIFNIFTGCCLRCMGRKTGLLIGVAFIIVSHALLSLGLFLLQPTSQGQGQPLFVLNNFPATFFILAGLFVFGGAFGMLVGPIIWLYIPEFTQPHIIPYSILANWLFTAILPTIFPILRDALPNKNPAPFFVVLGVLNLIFFVIIQTIGLETVNKTFAQVKEEMENFEICKKQ